MIDPFSPAAAHINVKVASVPADAVFITHESELSGYTDLASGSPQIFRSSMASGVNRASGLLVRGVRTGTENLEVTGRLNVAFVWSMDGVRFCHLGAIEDALSATEALNIGHVDVLFIPGGGVPNFTAEKRRITLERLQPRLIVPYSYTGAFDWRGGPGRIAHGGSRFTVSPTTLPAAPTVLLLGSR
jgi:putative intracellular protease/amidase